MEKFFGDFESVFGDESFFKECVEFAIENYRTDEKSMTLYKQVLSFSFQEKFSDSFISLVYETLKAWNMNSRAAKLAESSDFSQSMTAAKDKFESLQKYTIKDFANNPDIFNTFETLFNELHLTQTKTKLVTFSKTMHFFLPDLVAPIDGQYTLNFFYKSTYSAKEFQYFKDIHTSFSQFVNKHAALNELISKNNWNKSIPKLLDNAIIGMASKEQHK